MPSFYVYHGYFFKVLYLVICVEISIEQNTVYHMW